MVRHAGEDFIDIEGVTIASVLPLQSAGIDSSELDAPQAISLVLVTQPCPIKKSRYVSSSYCPTSPQTIRLIIG
jgi:hypothetical protein